jgi:hypothetical protein
LTPGWWQQNELSVRELKELHVALQRRVIHLWLTRLGITNIGFEEVERVCSTLTEREIAKVNLPAGNCCRRKAGKLFVEPQART